MNLVETFKRHTNLIPNHKLGMGQCHHLLSSHLERLEIQKVLACPITTLSTMLDSLVRVLAMIKNLIVFVAARHFTILLDALLVMYAL